MSKLTKMKSDLFFSGQKVDVTLYPKWYSSLLLHNAVENENKFTFVYVSRSCETVQSIVLLHLKACFVV